MEAPDVKSRLIRKDPDARKDWRQGEKGMTEDEMVGWHHCLNEHDFEQALEVGDGQGGLAWCSPWVAKSQARLRDWTDWLYTKSLKENLNSAFIILNAKIYSW